MRLKWKLVALALPAAVLVACKDQPSAPLQQTHTIAADYTNNPDGGGPWIMRGEAGFFWTAWNNPDATVRVYATTFPLSLAIDGVSIFNWDDGVCGPTGSSALHFQEISHWSLDHTDPSARYFANADGPVWIALVDRTASGPCNTRPLIASGWGTLKYNDNSETGSTKQDAWSYKADGNLTTPGGDPVTFSGHTACEYNTGAKVNYVCHNQINMH